MQCICGGTIKEEHKEITLDIEGCSPHQVAYDCGTCAKCGSEYTDEKQTATLMKKIADIKEHNKKEKK